MVEEWLPGTGADMQPVYTVAQVRDAENTFFAAHPDIDLMQRAAAQVAERALSLLEGDGAHQVLVAVGPGNNGGDGLFAARDLTERGVRVSLWCCVPGHVHAAGFAAAAAAGCQVVQAADALELLPDVDLVIDAVLGIGGRGGLPAGVSEFAEACEVLEVSVLAVDLPSGLDADSCQAGVSFWATETITFGGLKLCQVAEPARSRCGRVTVGNIGMVPQGSQLAVAELADVAGLWPVPDASSDKYSRGVLGIDTGSAHYPGAGVLSTIGALFSGAGFIRFCGPDEVRQLLTHRTPSVTFGEGKVQAWLVGCGWGGGDDDAARLARRCDDGVPLVVDAEAVQLVRGQPGRAGRGSLLTPHAGELARLLGVSREAVHADPLTHVRSAAQRFEITVLLKGATQYIAQPDGRVTIAVAGPSWTAQAGSGDTLAGICATLLASGLSAHWSAVLGASVQALTAQSNPGPWPPDVLAQRLPEVIADLTELVG